MRSTPRGESRAAFCFSVAQPTWLCRAATCRTEREWRSVTTKTAGSRRAGYLFSRMGPAALRQDPRRSGAESDHDGDVRFARCTRAACRKRDRHYLK
jgi:hypothetical protein